MQRAAILLSALACIAVVLNTNTASAQECVALHGVCSPTDPGCCQGYCQSLGSVGICACSADSWWNSCSSNTHCCNGYCNTRGYCGCISSNLECTEGRADECCGVQDSRDPKKLIKNCSSCGLFCGFLNHCY